MTTTIVVAVTLKIEAEGDTPEALVRDAVDRAMTFADNAAERHARNSDWSVTCEGATALVNMEALSNAA